MLAERAAAREKRLKKKAMLENECTFKPEIGNATAVLQAAAVAVVREAEVSRSLRRVLVPLDLLTRLLLHLVLLLAQ